MMTETGSPLYVLTDELQSIGIDVRPRYFKANGKLLLSGMNVFLPFNTTADFSYVFGDFVITFPRKNCSYVFAAINEKALSWRPADGYVQWISPSIAEIKAFFATHRAILLHTAALRTQMTIYFMDALKKSGLIRDLVYFIGRQYHLVHTAELIACLSRLPAEVEANHRK